MSPYCVKFPRLKYVAGIKMILLLDIGNTRIKWGGLIGGEFQSGGVLPRGEGDIQNVMAAVQAKQYRPSRVVVSNVAQASYCERLQIEVGVNWGCPVELVETQAAALGVVNGYDEPHQLGVDRWLALIAARQMYKGALCVVDCGTALTVDLLTDEGVHLGGMIAPGVSLMQGALLNNAAGLHVASEWRIGDDATFMARNTADAILNGARYSSIALIDRLYFDAQRELGTEVLLVLTGGDAVMLQPHLRHGGVLESELVLKGVAMIAGAADQ